MCLFSFVYKHNLTRVPKSLYNTVYIHPAFILCMLFHSTMQIMQLENASNIYIFSAIELFLSSIPWLSLLDVFKKWSFEIPQATPACVGT